MRTTSEIRPRGIVVARDVRSPHANTQLFDGNLSGAGPAGE